jgi:hypothetical protein
LTFSRRAFVRLSLGSAAFAATPQLLAQGVAAHTVQPVARAAPSGRPFYAHFVDVASSAGLQAPVIYGGVENKKYILEAVGCGCAFIDYDNDGWMDIFLLSGTRLSGDPPGATNRLYKNNRDGTFTDVTEKAGLNSVGWGSGVSIGDYNNDGFEDIFCTASGKTTCIATMEMERLPMSPKRPGCGTINPGGEPGAVSLITIEMVTSTCSSPTTCASPWSTRRCRART